MEQKTLRQQNREWLRKEDKAAIMIRVDRRSLQMPTNACRCLQMMSKDTYRYLNMYRIGIFLVRKTVYMLADDIIYLL